MISDETYECFKVQVWILRFTSVENCGSPYCLGALENTFTATSFPFSNLPRYTGRKPEPPPIGDLKFLVAVTTSASEYDFAKIVGFP